MAVARLPGVS